MFTWKVIIGVVLSAVSVIAVPWFEARADQPVQTAVQHEQPNGSLAQVPAAGNPELFIPRQNYDVGEVWEGEEFVHTFTIENRGTALLEITRVNPGWGCALASFDKAILPGREGKITLKVNTENMSGKLVKSATVYSNDPKNPQTNLYISGEVKPYLTITPQETVSLNGFVGEKVKAEVTITSLLPQPFTITKVKSDIEDKIKCKLVTRQKGKEYLLRIERRSKTEPYFHGQITLTTDSMKKPKITIGVSSLLRKEVAVSPESVSFGTIDTAAEYFANMKLSRTVTLQDMRGGGMTIEEIIASSDWIAAAHEKTKRGHAVEITLDKEKLPRGDFEETIVVRTNDRKKTIRIPIKGKVI